MQPTDDPDQPMFFVMAGTRSPAIMCERHAQAFEALMMAHEVPHTIYELEPDETHVCHACNLQDELDRPRIILPN